MKTKMHVWVVMGWNEHDQGRVLKVCASEKVARGVEESAAKGRYGKKGNVTSTTVLRLPVVGTKLDQMSVLHADNQSTVTVHGTTL